MESREMKARNWFQWTTKLLSKPKQAVTEHTIDLDTDSPDNYNYFPPELVENILLEVDEHSLFACRLVNRQWNSVASKELGRRNLLNCTSWEPTPDTHKQIYSSLSPAILNLNSPRKLMYSRLYLPPAIRTSKNFTTNPFPTHSLKIEYNYLHPSFSHMLQRSIGWKKFFRKYGHFLTQVNLTYFKETLWHLKQVLIHTPNLQVLSISSFGDKKAEGIITATKLQNRDRDRIQISPNLATLMIYRDCQLHLADWLLGLCANQLINLFIATDNERLLLCVFWRKFEKLKQLRIHFLKFSRGFCEIWDGASHPELQYLFIDMVFHWYDIDIHYNIYMDFIGQFSSTLVHLSMDVTPVCRGGFGYLKQKGIIFPKIRSLTLRNHSYDVSWEGTQAKKDAEVLFPNVSDVNLVDL
ncbi:unnamed protein product [Orchesella dallaii]|uniref:F-box domain-containing protein n=1 Tax=Orchesella dallaii TaxID=48710 RepID=A0ABP1RW22_9HEXA